MIQTLSLLVTALVMLALAVYAQGRIPYHTPSGTQTVLARLLLLLVALGFGWVMADVYATETGLQWWLIFLASFGLVHLPAAVILFLKGQRKAHG